MKKSEIAFGVVRVPVDFAMINLGFYLAYKLRTLGDFIPFIQLPTSLDTFPSLAQYMEFSSVSALVFIIFLAINRSYAMRAGSSVGLELKLILSTSFVWFTSIMAYYFLTRTFPFSRLVMLYALVLSVFTMFAARLVIRFVYLFFLKRGLGQRRVLILGANTISRTLSQAFDANSHYRVIKPSPGVTDYSRDNLLNLIFKYQIEEIVQTSQTVHDKDAREILDFCRENHLQYHFVPDLLEVQRSNLDFFSVGGVPIMSLKPTSLDGWSKVVKRAFDFIVSVIVLLFLLPVFLITSLLIKLDSRGPIFFTRKDDGSPVKRVGEKGLQFKFFKFRSMKVNTDSLRYGKLQEKSHREGPLVKIKHDPRITRVGRFIRKYSIDELPQLFNVLIGNMSLVGPRPHLPEEVAKYERHHKFVLTIKPGITGLAQISGRSDLDFEKEVKLDTYYIENWSLWLDLKILFKTIFVVLKGEGAD